MKVLIQSTFKTGVNKLRQIFGINGFMVQNQAEQEPLRYELHDNYVMCEHEAPLKLALENGRTYDYVFIGVRRPSEVIYSAIFQDIVSPNYCYKYCDSKEEVLAADPSRIVEHIMNWVDGMKDMPQLCHESSFKRISQRYPDFKLPEEMSDTGITVFEGNDIFKRFVVYTFDTLSNGAMRRFMEDTLHLRWNDDKLNAGLYKWYAPQYKRCRYAIQMIQEAIKDREDEVVRKFKLQ